MRSRTVPDTQISETDPVPFNADGSEEKKLPPIFIYFVESGESRKFRCHPVACELDRTGFAHDACSGKSSTMLFSSALQTPRSVISPVTRRRGVTSNPKFAAGLLSGARLTSHIRPSRQPS